MARTAAAKVGRPAVKGKKLTKATTAKKGVKKTRASAASKILAGKKRVSRRTTATASAR